MPDLSTASGVDWFRDLSAAERRTFGGCFAGWALDALDVTLFTFAIPALMAYWSVSRAAIGDLAAMTLLSSAAGGLGRRRAM